MRRQQEDGSGPGNHHDGLAEEARSPSSCTSTRAVGCRLRGPGQILQLKVERSVLLKSLRVVLLGYGENLQGEQASKYEESSSNADKRDSSTGATMACPNTSLSVLCSHHRMMNRRSRPTLQGRRSLDAKSHATSSVWSDVAFACGACQGGLAGSTGDRFTGSGAAQAQANRANVLLTL